jgi:hypothetical protein
MKTLCSFALASLLVALPTLAVSKQADSEAVMVQKELSPGVRLHAVDGERKRFAKTIPLASGTHVFEFTYAYDAERDQGGPWVSRFAFECSIGIPGTYTLRSKDSKVADMAPVIWIESANQVAPQCTRIGA